MPERPITNLTSGQEHMRGTKKPLYFFGLFDKARVLMTVKKTKKQIAKDRSVRREQEPLMAGLQDRSEKVSHIIQAVETFLELNQNQPTDFQAVFTEALSPLAKDYGFHIVQGDPTQDDSYAKRIVDHAEAYRTLHPINEIDEQELSFTFSQQSTRLRDRQSHEPDLNLYQNTSHVIPKGRLAYHPYVQRYTSLFNGYSDLQQVLEDAQINLISNSNDVSSQGLGTRRDTEGNEAFLKYNYTSLNLNRVINLLLIMGKSILWEGFDGNVIDLTEFAQYMNEILNAVDLHVDVKEPAKT